MQEAGAILNYDIHWNPVRLIQRIGRVDRRLNPAITPDDHAFDIINVLPPRRDQRHHQSGRRGGEPDAARSAARWAWTSRSSRRTDPAGNLKEFNAPYEGEITGHRPRADATTSASASSRRTPGRRPSWTPSRRARSASGQGAPQDGLFALFTMEPKPEGHGRPTGSASPPILGPARAHPGAAGQAAADRRRGDPGPAAQTTPDAPSGTPSDEADLAQRLKKLKEAVRRQYAEIGLPATILPQLVCWMELRQAQGTITMLITEHALHTSLTAPRCLPSCTTTRLARRPGRHVHLRRAAAATARWPPASRSSQIVPFSAGDPFTILLAEFETPFRRTDLREILRRVREEIRKRARYEGRALDEIVFVCATEGYRRHPVRPFRGARQGPSAPAERVRLGPGPGRTARGRCGSSTCPALAMPRENVLGEPDWTRAAPAG